MVYSTDLYVKSAQLPLFPIARKGTNYLLSQGVKSTNQRVKSLRPPSRVGPLLSIF
jgi:hypothetical protein